LGDQPGSGRQGGGVLLAGIAYVGAARRCDAGAEAAAGAAGKHQVLGIALWQRTDRGLGVGARAQRLVSRMARPAAGRRCRPDPGRRAAGLRQSGVSVATVAGLARTDQLSALSLALAAAFLRLHRWPWRSRDRIARRSAGLERRARLGDMAAGRDS